MSTEKSKDPTENEEKLINALEDVAILLRKSQVNLKKSPKSRLTKGYLESKLKCNDEYWTTFKATYSKLVLCTTKQSRGTIPFFKNEEFHAIEELYLCVQADIRDMIATLLEAGSANSTQNTSCMLQYEQKQHVKLPIIHLPKFTGKYEEWPTFNDLFKSLIHENTSITKIQKLHYLKSSMSGEAEGLLKHVQVVEDNYEQAWDILKQRFGNKRLIINSLLKKLFSLKKIYSQSANQIKTILDITMECLNSLQNQGISIENWDPIIVHHVVQKLDAETHKNWEEYSHKQNSEEFPTWVELKSFLETKFRILELVSTTPTAFTVKDKHHTKEKVCHVSTTPDKSCVKCKETHALSHCKDFGKLQVKERNEFVKNNKLCYNCLGHGHSSWSCRVPLCCRICKKRHHTLLHEQIENKQQGNIQSQYHKTNIVQEKDKQNCEETNDAIAIHLATKKSTALLATALVPVRDSKGQTSILRALIDQGSQANFISERAAQMLRVKRIPTKCAITGVGSTKTAVNHIIKIELLSRHDEGFKLMIKAFVMATQLTTHLPLKTIQRSSHMWPHLQDLQLADPLFNQSGQIDMLLGVDVYSQIIKSQVIKGPPNTPCAQNTSLGWILFGNVQDEVSTTELVVMHSTIDIDSMLRQFWEVDTDSKQKLTKEEKLCEEIYAKTYKRNQDGRYIVKLPFNTETPKSPEGNTREIALKRFKQLERRFRIDQTLEEEYRKVIDEYRELNHMEEIPEDEISNSSVYLPHHAVVREDKETSKVRVVFDASSKGSNDVSLNDELMVGPQLQEDMRSLIMRWRMRQFCYTADVKGMYRQILVTKEDSDYQRILWSDGPTNEVKDYRLLRVTFGTASAPYLAVKTLQQIAEDEGKCHPRAAQRIKEDFFADDIMSGEDTLNEAIDTAKNISAILERGGFKLQKWASNSPELLREFSPAELSARVNLDIKVDGTTRALGISWNMGEDKFQYHLSMPATEKIITKRIILAEIQRLFDPLGWLAPALIPAKIMIQKLWLEKIGWDDEVNPETKIEWLNIRKSYEHLKNIKLERWMHTNEKVMKNITIHGYCDSSIKAYGAVAYLRVQDESGDYKISLIAAKTRVAPVKCISLPRLELSGAVLLSTLLKQISEALRIPKDQIYAWTDSTIVLSWLQGDPGRWQTFVRNRVVTILDNIGNNWYHVQSTCNPADIASRGMLLPELIDNSLWWNGPEWLKQETIEMSTPTNINTDLELRKNITVNLKTNEISENNSLLTQFEDFDTMSELLTTISLCRRFLHYKREKNVRDNLVMTTQELELSLQICIKLAQKERFTEEIDDLKKKGKIKGKSILKSLNPFLSSDSILKVGGRIKHANIDEERKHPIILDDKNKITQLIIAEAHLKTLHGGLPLMLNYIRSKYWILRVKQLIKRYVHKCMICARHNATVRSQLMGDLPKERVTPARPFLNSGVDFAGPYKILMSRGRGAKTGKGYIAIFICMSTKAIHLEMVGDLTSESFIGAFKRFVARRGKCNHMWSDQGRNFIGANRELCTAWNEAKLEFEGDIMQKLAADGTQWHFIPAHSPTFGGLWEAGVKSMKHHLKRILNSSLTFEEMTTVLCQIEACLNSRPLCPIEENNIDSLEVLTPGHFLIGEAPITVPSPSLKDIAVSNLTRWHLTQKILNDFWHIWQQEYLSRLQQRPKWLKRVEEFKNGQIVLIKSDSLPPGKWNLGRVIDKHPGLDGITRVYSVKSGNSIVKRPVTKLCLMPVDTE